ncbi:hypothetical protein HN51_050332 [Arachis hypogaea]
METAVTLKSQTEQISKVTEELDSIHFPMKRASKLTKQFGRQIATNKCIMMLLLLIVIGVIAIVMVKARVCLLIQMIYIPLNSSDLLA